MREKLIRNPGHPEVPNVLKVDVSGERLNGQPLIGVLKFGANDFIATFTGVFAPLGSIQEPDASEHPEVSTTHHLPIFQSTWQLVCSNLTSVRTGDDPEPVAVFTPYSNLRVPAYMAPQLDDFTRQLQPVEPVEDPAAGVGLLPVHNPPDNLEVLPLVEEG